jgi:rfaE bifunctional protein nucleotidyltransferase chain/domain
MIVAKLKSAGELAVLRAKLDSRGQRLVFTNGCFDLLHVGHVRYLQAARALGEVLVVAVNGDDSVRALKGPGRPINSELDRAEVLAALAVVDFVTVFQTVRVTDLIRTVKPHVYVKGGDYTVEKLDADERAALQAVGSKIEIVPLVPGKSTTETLIKSSKSSPSPAAA